MARALLGCLRLLRSQTNGNIITLHLLQSLFSGDAGKEGLRLLRSQTNGNSVLIKNIPGISTVSDFSEVKLMETLRSSLFQGFRLFSQVSDFSEVKLMETQ